MSSQKKEITPKKSIGKDDLNILVLSIFLATLRGSVFWTLYANTSSIFAAGWFEVLSWCFLAFLIVRVLKKENFSEEFKQRWQQEYFLLFFIAFSLVSVLWSISITDTLYRFFILLLSSFAGSFMGYFYGVKKLIKILFWTGMFVVATSFAVVFSLPSIGIHYGHPYYGAWRGIYWHKNQLGSLMALFNAIFLLSFFMRSKSIFKRILSFILYVFSLLLVFFAKSAAGYILVMGLHLLIAIIAIWLWLRDSLKAIHYYTFLFSGIVIVIIIYKNLDFLFGLLGRSPSLTGRIPMWEILIRKVVFRSPWIGYGFGAVWTVEKFRVGMQHAAGWGYPILIADNGFLDILLHLGLIGLLLFLSVWISVWVRSIRHAFEKHTLLDFFPLVFMFYTFVGNLSFSLFLEVESLIWMILVALLFAVSKNNGKGFALFTHHPQKDSSATQKAD